MLASSTSLRTFSPVTEFFKKARSVVIHNAGFFVVRLWRVMRQAIDSDNAE
jgi:hypothetical protein